MNVKKIMVNVCMYECMYVYTHDYVYVCIFIFIFHGKAITLIILSIF